MNGKLDFQVGTAQQEQGLEAFRRAQANSGLTDTEFELWYFSWQTANNLVDDSMYFQWHSVA